MLRLSEDILRSIFETSLQASGEELRISLDISHVCHEWRRVALETPGLWSKITRKHPNFVDVQLERARNVPLQISWSTKDGDAFSAEDPPVEKLDMALQDLERVASVELDLVMDELDVILPSFDRPTPALVSFSLNYRFSFDSDAEGWPDSGGSQEVDEDELNMCHVLQRSFLPDAPALRKLTLVNVIIPWDVDQEAPVYDWPRLTHLDIQINRTQVDDQYWLKLEPLLLLLDNFRELQVLHLHLKHFIDLTGDPTRDDDQIVSLPSLTEIRMDLPNSSTATKFLEHLSAPPECSSNFSYIRYPING